MLAIAITKNLVFHARSKNIEIRHHFIRDLVNKEVKLEFMNTYDQSADMLPKTITYEKFEKFKNCWKLQI